MAEPLLPYYLPAPPRLPPTWAASQGHKRAFQVSLILWLLCIALMVAMQRSEKEAIELDGTITEIKEKKGDERRAHASFTYRDKDGNEKSGRQEVPTAYVKDHQLTPGSPVVIVEILGVSPYIKGALRESTSVFGVLQSIPLLASMVFFFFAWPRMKRRKVLMEGALAKGKITNISTKKTKGGPEYLFHYQFEAAGQAQSGADKIFIGPGTLEAILELDQPPWIGSVVYIAYNPKKPTNNAIYLFEEQDQFTRQEEERQALLSPPAPLPDALRAPSPRALPPGAPSLQTEYTQADLIFLGILAGVPLIFFLLGLIGVGAFGAMMLVGVIYALLFWPLVIWGYYSTVIKKQNLLRAGVPFAAKVLRYRWIQLRNATMMLSITFEGQGPNGPIRGKERIPGKRLALYGDNATAGDTLFFAHSPDNFGERALWGFGKSA